MAKNNSANVSVSDTKEVAEAHESPVAKEAAGGEIATNYVYIGPALPGAKLMTNAVISGTRKEISDYYKDVFQKYPNAEKLIVPVGKLSESRAKVSAGGNVLNKYYNDLLDQIKKGNVD